MNQLVQWFEQSIKNESKNALYFPFRGSSPHSWNTLVLLFVRFLTLAKVFRISVTHQHRFDLRRCYHGNDPFRHKHFPNPSICHLCRRTGKDTLHMLLRLRQNHREQSEGPSHTQSLVMHSPLPHRKLPGSQVGPSGQRNGLYMLWVTYLTYTRFCVLYFRMNHYEAHLMVTWKKLSENIEKVLSSLPRIRSYFQFCFQKPQNVNFVDTIQIRGMVCYM